MARAWVGRKSRLVTWVVIGMIAVAVIGLFINVLVAGVGGALVSVLAATLPAVLIALSVLVFDRYDPEPRSVLALTFAFGATGAILMAALGEGAASVALQTSSGQLVLATLVAPFIEEIAKGLAVIAVALWLKDDFSGIVDGMVYAVMVGCGFAFAENIVYYTSALLQGQSTFVATVIVRGGFTAFAHPLFTCMTGVGLALSAQRHGPTRYLPALLGLFAAIVLHGFWNAANAFGSGFILVYVVIYLPLLAVVILTIALAAHAEGQALAYYLAYDVSTGLLAADELAEMTSLSQRRQALRAAATAGGPAAVRLRKSFQHAAAQLAFARYRSRPNRLDPATEMRWVRAVARVKRAMDPAWMPPPGVEE